MVGTHRGQWGTLLHAATQGPRLTEALSACLGPDREPPEKREAGESRPLLNHRGPRHPCPNSSGEDSAVRGAGDARKGGHCLGNRLQYRVHVTDQGRASLSAPSRPEPGGEGWARRETWLTEGASAPPDPPRL